MKAQTPKIVRAFEGIAKVAGKRTALPITSCVKLEANDGVLSLSATNCDCFTVERIPCEGDLAPVCVPADKLSPAIHSSCDEVELTLEGGKLRVNASGSFALATQDAAEMPKFPEVDPSTLVTIDPRAFSEALMASSWAASSKSGDIWQECVGVNTYKGNLYVTATDKKTIVNQIIKDVPATIAELIPARNCRKLADALLLDGAELYVSSSYITCIHDQGMDAIKLAEGQYPAIWNVLEQQQANCKPIGELPVDQLVPLIATAASLGNEVNFAPVELTFSKTGLAVRFNNGIDKFEKDLEGSFGEFKADYDASRLLTMLKSCPQTDAKASFAGTNLILEFGDLYVGVAGITNRK